MYNRKDKEKKNQTNKDKKDKTQNPENQENSTLQPNEPQQPEESLKKDKPEQKSSESIVDQAQPPKPLNNPKEPKKELEPPLPPKPSSPKPHPRLQTPQTINQVLQNRAILRKNTRVILMAIFIMLLCYLVCFVYYQFKNKARSRRYNKERRKRLESRSTTITLETSTMFHSRGGYSTSTEANPDNKETPFDTPRYAKKSKSEKLPAKNIVKKIAKKAILAKMESQDLPSMESLELKAKETRSVKSLKQPKSNPFSED